MERWQRNMDSGAIVGADSIFIHAQKADNGYVLHASMNAPAGQTARSFTRVVPADGDLVGELAALIATLKIS